MAEGVADDGKKVQDGFGWFPPGKHSKTSAPARPPEPGPDPENAPYGFMFDEKEKGWRPRKKAGRAGGAAGPKLSAVPGEGEPYRDPDPAHMASLGGADEPLWDPKKVSRDTQNDIAAMLALFYSVPADLLVSIDPYCFGALNENLEATIDATVPIICRSKMAVEFVSGASGLILWIKLMATLKPFLVAVWQHHVTGAVELEKETDDQGEKTGNVIVHKQDFSAYTAA